MDKRHLINESSFYDQAYSNNENRRERGFAWGSEPSHSLVSLLHDNHIIMGEGVSVLDCGCGDGRHIQYFRSYGCEVTGIEISKKALDLCKYKFKEDRNVTLLHRDLTEKDSLADLGHFNLILDWSVLGHIRKCYQQNYISNLISTLNEGGHIIAVEFDISLPGLFKNKDYRIRNGHYSRGFTIESLSNCWRNLKLIDYKTEVMEDEVNGYKFNAVLMKK
jgi:SAM-dependent methyltransferase